MKIKIYGYPFKRSKLYISFGFEIGRRRIAVAFLIWLIEFNWGTSNDDLAWKGD
jgi:hypothetical protein